MRRRILLNMGTAMPAFMQLGIAISAMRVLLEALRLFLQPPSAPVRMRDFASGGALGLALAGEPGDSAVAGRAGRLTPGLFGAAVATRFHPALDAHITPDRHFLKGETRCSALAAARLSWRQRKRKSCRHQHVILPGGRRSSTVWR